MKKRIIALLLALAMSLSLLSMGAWAAEAELVPEEPADLATPAETVEEEVPEETTEANVEVEEAVTEEAMYDGNVTHYGLWVGDVEVTSANEHDIPLGNGNGSASYDSTTHTLTLTDAVIQSSQGALIEYTMYDENVTLTVTGSAELGGQDCTNPGIWVRGCNLAVVGTGTGIQYTGSSSGISCFNRRPDSAHDYSGGSLSLGGKISVTTTGSDAVFADWDITVENGVDLTAITTADKQSGMHSYYGPITIEGGTVYAEGGCGIKIYKDNKTDADVTDPIEIEGGTVTAIGTGDEYGAGYGIYGWNGITLSGGTIRAESTSTGEAYDSYGLYAYKGGITIENGVTQVSAKSNPEAEYTQALRCGDLTIGEGLSLTDPVNGAYGTSTIYPPDSNTPATQFTLVPGTTPLRRSLTNAQVTLAETYFQYTGEIRKPAATVKMLTDDTVLQEGRDYTLLYTDSTVTRNPVDPWDGGSYYVFATGMGQYSGECYTDFTIRQLWVSDSTVEVSVTGIEDKPYTGSPVTQTPTVVVNGRTLVQDKEYYVAYQNNVEVGTATFMIYSKCDAYRGSFWNKGGKGTFQITAPPAPQPTEVPTEAPQPSEPVQPVSIAQAAVTLSPGTVAYDGKAKPPL